MNRVSQFWQRIVAVFAARNQNARYVRSLECELERLRAENRALVNSILGIAGIPPIHVERSSERAFQAVAEIARDEVQGSSREDFRIRTRGSTEQTAALREAAISHTETSEKIPALRHSESARADDESAPRPRPNSRARFALPRRQARVDVGAPPPAGMAAGDDSLGNRSVNVHNGRPRNDSPHPASSMRPIAPPHRRRSWHQINRILEIESARKVATRH